MTLLSALGKANKHASVAVYSPNRRRFLWGVVRTCGCRPIERLRVSRLTTGEAGDTVSIAPP